MSQSEIPALVEVPGAADIHENIIGRFSRQTPWWVVSILFHGLLIVLVGLFSLTIELPEDNVILTTSVFRPAEIAPEAVVTQAKGEALVPTPLDEHLDRSNIYVTESMKALAEAGNVFETPTMDADTKELGARGTQDAKIFMLTDKPTDAPGGSGNGAFAALEETIGVGLASPGFGKGKGIQNGDGSGSWGNRNAGGRRWAFKRYNTDSGHSFAHYNTALDNGLRWLAYHQEADGHWDVKKYGAAHKNDTAITSLALLAFVSNGDTEKVGEHKDTVKRAVAWLRAHQGPDGLISEPTDDSAIHRRGGYPMAIATLALAEAAGMANVKETREAAQRAVDYCVNIHQQGEGSDKMGWRYAAKSEGDLSVTGWFIMALKSAKVAKLKVDSAAFEGALRFLESVEVKDPGTDSGYGPVSHFKYTKGTDHADTAHRLTAIGTLARQFMGWKKEELQGSVDWFIKHGGLPEFGGNGEKVDLYYWYYGSMATFQQGNPVFGEWSKALLTALLPNQKTQGDDLGSWDPAGPYSEEWGRVGQTALSLLSLEVYFKYGKIYEH